MAQMALLCVRQMAAGQLGSHLAVKIFGSEDIFKTRTSVVQSNVQTYRPYVQAYRRRTAVQTQFCTVYVYSDVIMTSSVTSSYCVDRSFASASEKPVEDHLPVSFEEDQREPRPPSSFFHQFCKLIILVQQISQPFATKLSSDLCVSLCLTTGV